MKNLRGKTGKIAEPTNLGEPDFPVWNDDLQCYWYGVRVRDEGHLALHLEERNCCDAGGAVRLAKMVMPNVFHIDVFSGNDFDCYYFLNGKSVWNQFTPKNKYPYRNSKVSLKPGGNNASP